jgi:hypothetical protein
MRSNLDDRGRSLLGYSADLVEWSADKNLAIAGDVASFIVAQMRLPTEVRNLGEYRAGLRRSVSSFSEALFDHGKDYAVKITGLPREFWHAVNSEPRSTRRKTAKPAVATKKAAVKKFTAHQAA